MNAFAQPDVTEYHSTTARLAAGEGTTVGRVLQAWRTRGEERRVLALLTERDFHDMGHTRSELEYELARPFWRG